MKGLMILMLVSLMGKKPYRCRYWEIVGVDSAWSYTRGDTGTLVGVIDMGFDFYHPDLKDVIRPGYFADGVYHTEIYEVVAHGTGMASIIHSLAPECPILTASSGVIRHDLLILKKQFEKEHPDSGLMAFQKEIFKHMDELKAFGQRWQEFINRTTSEGIRYLVDNGVRVINLSALTTSSPEMDSAFAYAAEHDVVIVIGAGNSDREYEDYPGDGLKNVIVVGASNLKGERWEMEAQGIKQGSNYGRRLTVVAPSESLIMAAPHEERFYHADDSPLGQEDVEFDSLREFVPYGATSCATAIVSGLAALIRSLRPDLSAAEVVEIIEKGADDLGDPGYDIYTGYGQVNFARSLEIAKNWRR